MSTATGSVVVAIKAVDEASSTMDKIRSSLSIFGDTIGKLGGGFDSLGGVIKGFAGGGVMGGLAATVGEVATGLQDCFKAAKDSEDVWNKLAGTVEKSGAVWTDVKDQIEAFASSAEKMSKFSDEQVAAALKTMMDYGMGLDEAMKSLATTMDLAAGKQIDLETAAKAVGRAFEGNASLLTRMGVEVTKSKDDSVVFADAMTKLQEKFGGAAQKDLETYAGKQALVANAMDNLKEKIGGALIPVLSSFQDMMGNVVKGADALVTDLAAAWKAFGEIPEVKKIAESLSGAWTDMQKGMGQVADELGKTLMPIFKELWAALRDVWKALSPVVDAFGEVWKAIVSVGKDGKEAYTVFNLIADVLKVTIVPALTALVEGIKLVTPLIKGMADAFKVGIETVLFWIDKLNESFETLKKAAQGVSEFFTNLWSGLTGQTKEGVSKVTDEVKKGTGQITTAFDDLKKEISSESIWPDMWQEMIKDTVASMDEISATIGVAIVEIADLLEDQSPDLSDMLDPLLTAKVTLEQMNDVFGDLVDSSGSIGEALDKLQAGLSSGGISMEELHRGFIELSTKISTSQGDMSKFAETISRCLEDMLDPLISANVTVQQMHTAFGVLVEDSTSLGGALDMLRNKFDSGEVSLRTLNEGFAKLAKLSVEVGALGAPALGTPATAVAASSPSTTYVTIYSSVGTLAVGNKSELDDYLRQLHRTVVDAVRSS